MRKKTENNACVFVFYHIGHFGVFSLLLSDFILEVQSQNVYNTPLTFLGALAGFGYQFSIPLVVPFNNAFRRAL